MTKRLWSAGYRPGRLDLTGHNRRLDVRLITVGLILWKATCGSSRSRRSCSSFPSGSRSGILEIVRRDGVYGVIFTSGTITGLTADGWTLANELRESQLLPDNILTGSWPSTATSRTCAPRS